MSTDLVKKAVAWALPNSTPSFAPKIRAGASPQPPRPPAPPKTPMSQATPSVKTPSTPAGRRMTSSLGSAQQPLPVRQPLLSSSQQVTPASQESWWTAPVNFARELASGGPVAQQFFGFRDAQGQPAAKPAYEQGPNLFRRGGSLVQSAMGTGMLPFGVAADALQGNGNMDYTKMMTRDALQGLNTNFGLDIGHDVKARPRDAKLQNINMGPDEGRAFLQGHKTPSGVDSLSATEAMGKKRIMEQYRPDAEGGGPLSRIYNATMAPLTQGGSSAQIAMAAVPLTRQFVPIGMAWNGLGQIANEMFPGAGAEQQRIADWSQMQQIDSQAATQMAAHANKPRVTDSALSPQKQVENWRAENPDAPNPYGPQPDETALLQEAIPGAEDIQALSEQFLEQVQQFMDQATTALKGTLAATPEQAAQTAQMLETGELPEEMTQQGITAWTEAGYDPQQAMSIWNEMSPASKVVLGAGLGLGVLGLFNSLAGEGGIGSLLMSILGLGAAAYTGAQSGLFDQGAQDLTSGISDAVGGLMSPQKPSPMVQQMGSDSMILAALQQAAEDPQVARQLDQAAGTGSWVNQVLGWWGNATGMRQQIMQDRYGVAPDQQQRILDIWRQHRNR